MKKLLPLLFAVFVITVNSCKQNPCEGVVCNNGGSCEDGNCECLPAWGGPNCNEHSNPCDTIICKNGGNCQSNDGSCDCPGHTSGRFCEIQEAPDHLYITRLTAEGYNVATGPGSSQLWDDASEGNYPDIYPVIKKNGAVVYMDVTRRVENAGYVTFYPWVLGDDSIRIDDIYNNSYRMELWDYDGGGGNDDLMYAKDFAPYTDTTGFRGGIEFTDTIAYYDKFNMGLNLHYFW